ncbi:hypothetical protein, partial [Pseudomonas sp. B3(2017)]|uniref:hypothetical protein n=1 Tax=Pseudomonas sp. B3(2017) TaxID=1981717 RepID=UPI001C471DF6
GYFQKFSKFLFQLQPLALSISRQREANSTALHAAVNTSFFPPSTGRIETPKGPNITTLFDSLRASLN